VTHYLKKEVMLAARRHCQERSADTVGLGGEPGKFLYSQQEMQQQLQAEKAANGDKCPNGHREGELCFYDRPIKHLCQDESAFKQHHKSAFFWSVNGKDS